MGRVSTRNDIRGNGSNPTGDTNEISPILSAARERLQRLKAYSLMYVFTLALLGHSVNYVGHAEKWEAIEIDGSLDARDCAVAYKKGGRTLAIVTISRDLQSLQAEAAMEAEIRCKDKRSPDGSARRCSQ